MYFIPERTEFHHWQLFFKMSCISKVTQHTGFLSFEVEFIPRVMNHLFLRFIVWFNLETNLTEFLLCDVTS
uniref:Uncharacterized protein n=1 Tax=Amphimedon queenslandica TaxID=400682 RepID=A0A1X7URE3_AMPQE